MSLTKRRASFQQLLLVAFLLIAALLGASALAAVFNFDKLMAQSAGFQARALQLNAAAQSLAERSANMERAARQSLILNDTQLRQRFEEAGREALNILSGLRPPDLPEAVAERWRAQFRVLRGLMDGPSETNLDRERLLAAEFRDLEVINSNVAQQVQQAIAQRNGELTTQLKASRDMLTRQVMAAIALAVVLAVAFGIWLARPFKRIEHAIVGLGENRLEDSIDIQGPSDVRRVGQQLEWLRLRLTELDADKARFLRHISHELKTPLAAMREGVSLLSDGVAGELNNSQREVVGILHQNTLSLQSQIEALLRFNAAAFEARQLRREPCDLRQLLEDQVDAQRLQWRGHGLVVRIEGESVTARVDVAKMGTVIANLLSNAIRFSPPGGKILLQLSANAGTVTIDIHDSGPGVAEADRARIFEPFFRGQRQPSDAVRGTGVGLSIVHEYVAAHGGQITLLPEQPGAHFRLQFPG